MKKLNMITKKVSVGVVAGALAVGALGMSIPQYVYAEKHVVGGPGETVQSGSLKIHTSIKGTEGEPLDGVEYTIYKIMTLTPGDTTSSEDNLYYSSYTVEAPFQQVMQGVNPNSLKNYSAQEIETLYKKLRKAALSAGSGVTSATATTTGGTATFPNLDLGYYLVVESNVPAGYIGDKSFMAAIPSTNNYDGSGAGNSWVYDIEINAKNEKLSVKNKLTAQTSGTGDVEVVDGTVAEGDFVQYTITTTIPDYADDYFYSDMDTEQDISREITYTIRDILSDGLAIQDDGTHAIKVAVGGAEIGRTDTATFDKKQPGNTYTVQQSNVTGEAGDLVLDFATSFLKEHRGEAVTVTYWAKANESLNIGNTPNTSKAQVQFSTESHSDVTDTIQSETVSCYSFQLNVVKFGENRLLQGAEFGLYTDKEMSKRAQNWEQNKVTNENGQIVFPRMDEGTYYLVEEKAPEGFTLLANPIRIKVTADPAEGVDGLNKGTFSVLVDGNTIGSDSSDVQKSFFVSGTGALDGVTNVAVENMKGFSLPATGGNGIAIFLFVGIAGAVSVLVVEKKKSKREC